MKFERAVLAILRFLTPKQDRQWLDGLAGELAGARRDGAGRSWYWVPSN